MSQKNNVTVTTENGLKIVAPKDIVESGRPLASETVAIGTTEGAAVSPEQPRDHRTETFQIMRRGIFTDVQAMIEGEEEPAYYTSMEVALADLELRPAAQYNPERPHESFVYLMRWNYNFYANGNPANWRNVVRQLPIVDPETGEYVKGRTQDDPHERAVKASIDADRKKRNEQFADQRTRLAQTVLQMQK